WEYPWFAAWDLCFQSVVFARIDPHFAKNQLLTLAREFYMSPDGAIPAYEWAFGDVNPPLHAWAALRIFDIEREMHGRADHTFLEAIFSYCLMYFTWWANRKDADDNDLFSGGFLGLDNISIVDRSHLDQLAETIGQPVKLSQSDGTSWMGMFSLNLLEMATRLSHAGHSEYDRLADKFLQHFVFISDAINGTSEKDGQKIDIWDETDGFYYDVLKVGNGDQARYLPVKLRSLVGVIALFPCMVFNVDELKAPLARGLNARLDWFEERHPELLDRALVKKEENGKQQRLLSFVHPSRLCRILSRVLDEAEMLGAHGIRGLSKAHLNPPYRLDVNGTVLTERYEPAESAEGLFGGNSNWRGPVWFPINFLLIESLLRYHAFLGDEFTVEYPTGSGRQATLREVAGGLTDRLVAIFERDANQRRPVFGGNETFQTDPKWGDHILFYEYFHGDNGAGIGASHQTGWTGLVAELLHGIGTESSIPNTQNKTRSRSTTQLAALAFMRGLLR
ncbi:MAG: glucosidase, partial [Myxococcota bacterium]